jgi:hypothetical protein
VLVLVLFGFFSCACKTMFTQHVVAFHTDTGKIKYSLLMEGMVFEHFTCFLSLSTEGTFFNIYI